MNRQLERTWKEINNYIIRYCLDIWLQGLRKITDNMGQNSWSLGRDLNWRPTKYEAGVLNIHSQCSIKSVISRLIGNSTVF
jgi:hypothetical protein